jgi:hypothetical protein
VRRLEVAQDARAVPVEVADDRVQLGECDPQGFRLTVGNIVYGAMATLTFDRRYRGPLTSANGGYASGSLAAHVASPVVEVTLRLPPPLDRTLEVRREGERTLLVDESALVAEAVPGLLDVDAPAPLSVAEAESGAARSATTWPDVFRECFVCGVRPDHDGLEIHVGPVPGREPLHAAPWTAREPTPAVVWAAIDCPGAYAVGAAGRGAVVLGRMTARVDRVPTEGEQCVVVSWPLGEDGRKLYAGTALYSAEGELLALARQTWIEPRA